MVPVNLALTFEDREYITPQQAQDVEHLRKRVAESGMFLDTKGPRSPFTVRMTYSMDDGSSTVLGFSLFMLRAVTLFLVPIPQEVEYKLKVKVFYGAGMIAERDYTATNKPLYLLFRLNLHQEGIDMVFRKMQLDFRETPPVPLVGRPSPTESTPPPSV